MRPPDGDSPGPPAGQAAEFAVRGPSELVTRLQLGRNPPERRRVGWRQHHEQAIFGRDGTSRSPSRSKMTASNALIAASASGGRRLGAASAT